MTKPPDTPPTPKPRDPSLVEALREEVTRLREEVATLRRILAEAQEERDKYRVVLFKISCELGRSVV